MADSKLSTGQWLSPPKGGWGVILFLFFTFSPFSLSADVLEVARRVNSYFMAKWPDPTKDTFVGRKRPSSLWTRGVYYEGLMALYGIDPQPSYIKYVDDWGNYHKWTPRNGTRTRNADDQCCIQTYLDRYEMTGDKRMLDSCRVNMEAQMAEHRTDYWTWIDAIQMAMPAYAKMYSITGDTRYILFARDCYEWTRNTCGGGLWNAKEGLWWRDANFTPPYKESDGQNCYWSRGNGWVVAAYVKTLSNSPLKGEDYKSPFKGDLEGPVSDFFEELKADYLAMMEALLKCQREDGFWNVSLMSPTTYGGPETSGTALFLMGMAWGVRNGLLPEQEYRPAIDKAWNAIATKAIHEDGFIGYLQGTGKEPKDGQPVTYTSVPDFEDYGTGCVLLGAVEYYKLTKSPTSQAGARWWWLGSAVTEQGLKWQMQQMASHGIRTLEITPLYGVQGNDQNNIPFLSPEWMKMLEYTINEGKRQGIQIDMNLGTGWPFGSPETPLSEAACKLVVIDTLVEAGLAQINPLPLREGRGGSLIIQKDFKSKEKGKRRVIALYESRTRQKVKRAAPGGEGYVIDHFDSTAVAHYLSRFDKAFKSSSAPMPATFFNDSYEVFGADWTPTLLNEFHERRGYRLEDKLQEFVDGDAQVISDYRETLSDLLLKNFTEQWVKWSHERGVKVRNQAHGSPANLIDIYAAVDIPEIEGFGLSDFGIKGLRTDPGMTRKNFSDLSMLKYASSAAHVTGKRLVSSETFTWLTEHFRTSLSQMKPDLDLMFCSGVNRIFFHGACYSPKDDPWPGWKFYASVDMSPTNSIWRDAPMLTSYIDFCQQRLQEGQPDNDFLVLLPVRNMWRTNLDKRLMLFEINSMDKKAPEFIASILKIDSLGYDCDYISEKYLLGTSFADGKLQTAAGTRYAALILPPGCILSKAARKHLERLKHQGAHIIYNIESRELVKYAKPEELRTELHFKMIRRKVGDGYRYFVSNLTSNDVQQEVSLASTGGRVNISLRSGESCFIDALPDGKATVTYPVDELQPSNSHFSLFTLHSSLLIDLSENKWSLSFIESQPAITDTITIDGLKTWESLPNDSLNELMGTGVYETSFNLSPSEELEGNHYRLDLGDVRESARVYVNGTYIGCAWCVPFTLDFDGLLHEGENTIRIEVTNLPANRIAAYDRRGVQWRKFNEINVVDINYKHTTYADWSPIPSGLNSYVRIYKQTPSNSPVRGRTGSGEAAAMSPPPYGGVRGGLWPDGNAMDAFFSNTTKVDIQKLGKQYVITDYGVKNDSTLMQTAAIQAVIDRCASEGGGVIVIPEGTFLSGSLFFKQGTNLYVKGRLKGSDRIRDFKLLETRMEGQTLQYFAALINADGLDGFCIAGDGAKLDWERTPSESGFTSQQSCIDGNGFNYWEEFWLRRMYNKACTNLEAMRPRLVYLSNCKNVIVQDINLINSPFWTNHLYRCERVRYLDNFIYAPTKCIQTPSNSPVRGRTGSGEAAATNPPPNGGDRRGLHGAPSSDAIDLDVCHDVLVHGCYMQVNDDAVVLKGGKGTWADKDPNNGPVYNVLVKNCRYGKAHGCLTLGSESIHDWNIVLSDIKINGVNRVLWLKMRPDTPQHYEKIRVENISGTCSSFLVVRPWTQFFQPGDRPDMPVSQANDITFRNIDVETDNFFDVGTSDKYKLQDFTFEDCKVRDKKQSFDPTMIEGCIAKKLFINGVEK